VTTDVRLVEITAGTLRPVLKLGVGPGQAGFVADNAVSIAQAHFEPAAWFRAIVAGEEPVGFAMIHDPTLPGATPDPDLDGATITLWRLMIDARFQGRGYGGRAVALLVNHARTRPGITRFATTYVEGDGGPAGFYRRLGFTPTGRVIEGESEAILDLVNG
jgi:diamine N-acetyltransferase